MIVYTAVSLELVILNMLSLLIAGLPQPRGLVVDSATNTSVTLTWELPYLQLDGAHFNVR